jgi:hypothetical protein
LPVPVSPVTRTGASSLRAASSTRRSNDGGATARARGGGGVLPERAGLAGAQHGDLAREARVLGGAAHGGVERLEVDGLLEEVGGAGAHGADGGGDVGVAGEEEDGHVRVVGPQRLEEREAVRVGEAHVGEHHVGRVRRGGLPSLGGGAGGARDVAERREEVGERLADRGVVVDDEDGERHGGRESGIGGRAPGAASAPRFPPPDSPQLAGRVIVSAVPTSGALSIVIVPPCSSTMRWQRARPMPVPPALVE